MKDIDVTLPLLPYGHHIGTPPRDTNLISLVYLNISPNHWRGCLYLNLLFIFDLIDLVVAIFVLDGITVKTSREMHVGLSTEC